MSNLSLFNSRAVNLIDTTNGTKKTLSPSSLAESVIFEDGESLQYKFSNRRLTERTSQDHVAAKIETVRNNNTTSYALKIKTNCYGNEHTEIVPIVNDLTSPRLTRKEATDIFLDVFGAKTFSSF